ncbi:DoxX family protein [Bernardetia sp. ABR2-2B]|uniref:DoxX family protein n=1 Tax=Bernardetia sp. ABR2-2B TaxID=3127472 RepID=UPI0030CC97DC
MKNKILFGVSLLFGLIMINGGLNKFFNYLPLEMGKEAMDLIAVFKSSRWIFNLVAVVEIIAGILIIIPKTRALAAIMIFPIVVGIVLFHIFQDPANMIASFVFLVINLWIIFENKEKYIPMISK